MGDILDSGEIGVSFPPTTPEQSKRWAEEAQERKEKIRKEKLAKAKIFSFSYTSGDKSPKIAPDGTVFALTMKQWENETWETWRFAYINRYVSNEEELEILKIEENKVKKIITLTYLRIPRIFSNF